MDPTLIMQNNENHNLDDLPPQVIGKIISSLPIKEAVRTSILAKPWKDQWMDTSNIEMREAEYNSRQHFIDGMDKLFTIHSSLQLQKFSLSCDVDGDTAKVNQWLNGFIKPMIQELEIELEHTSEQLVFPEHLFNSTSLTHLDLSMNHPIILPSPIHFAALRILTLTDVKFIGTTQTQNFFSGCPSLQELSLIDCRWDNVESFRIDSPSLHLLIIQEWGFLHNVHPCNIVINGNNNLKTFSYCGRLINRYTLFDTSSVNFAILDVYPPLHLNILNPGQSMFNFLVAFPNVEKLLITSFAIIALCHSPDLINMIPMFNNLVDLDVGSEAAPVNLSCNAMLTILRNAPNLENLQFLMTVALNENFVDEIDPIPLCLETNIKYISIYHFRRTEEEKVALKFLLKWAKVLAECNVLTETDEIDLYGKQVTEDMYEEISAEIYNYPKAETCHLYFD